MFNKTSTCFALLLAVALLVAGCNSNTPASQNVDTSPGIDAEQQHDNLPSSPNSGLITNVQNVKGTMQITTYQATKDGMYLVPEIHMVPQNDHPAKTALELLIIGTQNPELVSIVPPETKVLAVKVMDHIAYANFNDKIIKNNRGGSTNEILLVAAIVNTLAEFPQIQKVQILVDGKKVATLNGHMDISEPLSRSEEIIKR